MTNGQSASCDDFGGMVRPDALAVPVMLTRRCNMTCRHCSVASGPGIPDEIDDAGVERLVEEALHAGAAAMHFTGGEPMLRDALLERLLARCQSACVSTAVTTNGFWATSASEAERRVARFCELGLSLLTVSYDVFHAAFLPVEPIRRIAAACQRRELMMTLNVTRGADEAGVAEVAAVAREFPAIRMRLYDVQPVGRAKGFAAGALRANSDGFCEACSRPTIADDGRVLACNGPSYFLKPESPLVCGAKGAPLAEAFARHASDPYLEGIRVLGPRRLLEMANRLAPPGHFRARDRYTGICDICTHLSSSPEVVNALRDHLASPPEQAHLAATRRAIRGQRRAHWGNIERVNAWEVPLLLLRMAGGTTTDDARLLLSRADVDWARQLRLLSANSLLRPLAPALQEPVMERWAPAFFAGAVRAGAEAAALRWMAGRRALRRVAGALDGLGAHGVLLKTPSVTLDAAPDDHVPPPGDLDIFITDGRAAEVHEALRHAGFALWSGQPRGPTPHHLPVLDIDGIPLELHTRLGPAWLGMPEDRMLADLLPLAGPVARLRPEPLLLHVLLHSACHGFERGLKTAWTFRRILATADVRWNRLAELVADSAAGRAFWAAASTLAGLCEPGVPAAFLEAKPSDRIQKRMDRIARTRMLAVPTSSENAEPFLAPAVIMLSQQRLPTWDALAESARLGLKEASWRARTSRASIGADAGFGDLVRHHRRGLARTYSLVVAG